MAGLKPTYWADKSASGPPDSLVLKPFEPKEADRAKLIVYPLREDRPAISDRQNKPADRDPEPRQREFDQIADWLEGRGVFL